MTDAVRLIWLDDGGLPTFPFVGTFHYMTGGDDDKENPKLRWHHGASNRNVYVPLICTTVEAFLLFMEEPHEVEGKTLYIAVRSYHSWTLADGTLYSSLMVAVAIVEGDIEGSVQHPWRFEPLNQISALCTLVECKEEPKDPILAAAWKSIEKSRAVYRAWEEVQNRAHRLLVSNLDEEQRADLKKKSRFRVQDADGLWYLITYETHGNVWRVTPKPDGGWRQLVNYCIVPNEHIPIYDQMLAQKLMIETDIETFKSIANATLIGYDENDKAIVLPEVLDVPDGAVEALGPVGGTAPAAVGGEAQLDPDIAEHGAVDVQPVVGLVEPDLGLVPEVHHPSLMAPPGV